MYLASFYKLKFEKYAFNMKRAAPFAVAPLIWGKFVLTQWCGLSGPTSTTLFTLTSSHPPEVCREESSRIDHE